MKKYRLLNSEGYDPKSFIEGKEYNEDYKPNGLSPISSYVLDYPNDWEEITDVDAKINQSIHNLKLLIESKVLLRDIEAYKQTISTSDSEVYIELANDQIKRLQKRLSTIEKQIAQ